MDLLGKNLVIFVPQSTSGTAARTAAVVSVGYYRYLEFMRMQKKSC